MDASERVAAFWSAFLARTARPPATPLYESFAFGDGASLATSLAELVRRGEKAATAPLLWENEAEGKRPPQPGDLSVVTAWDGRPLGVIETTGVEVHALEDVGAEFAAAEGGRRPLARRLARGTLELLRTRLRAAGCEGFRVVFDPDREER